MKGPSSSSSSSSYSKMVLRAVKLLLALVFLGWMMLWVMRPTNTYRNKWSMKLTMETYSTYFGKQGMNILIFTFPVLFISVVGCVYLHLVKSRQDFEFGKLSHRLNAWNKPVIVKGPMGIITAMELAFWLKFLALIIWALSVYINNSFATITVESAKQGGMIVWQKRMKTAGLRFGLVGNMCFAFLFFPVTRASSLLPLVGLTSEASIKYHVWLGHIVMIFFTVHGLCYVIVWIATNNALEMLEWGTHHVANVPGEIALLAGLIIWLTTFPRIRRKTFELFFYSHQLYIVFLIFFLLHVGISSFCTILPGVYLFVVDRYLRFLQSRRKVRLVSARLLPSEAMELNFSKSPGFSYTPMSSVFINVPGVSWLQWHPYTVSSSSSLEADKLSVIIKKEGSWTQKLFQTLNRSSLDRLDVSIEGPYGHASINFLRHDNIVLVSGGSGITPFISIIREQIYRTSIVDSPTSNPTILLICSFKTSLDLTMLDLLLPISTLMPNFSRLNLRIEAFVTREKEPPNSDAHKSVRTIWFMPKPSDLPISPVLGTNSWLWLGAIISSSFVAFLVLIGVLTRYYIYPIQSKGESYSVTSSALLNMLFICGCIAFVAGGAVLWNRKESQMEDNRVQVLDELTPRSSPGSWFYNGDRELESVPHETLAQATTFHYGTRLDLKRMIMEIEGSSVGVMASGPSSLRREVAAICSSSQACNLHFESMSFNW